MALIACTPEIKFPIIFLTIYGMIVPELEFTHTDDSARKNQPMATITDRKTVLISDASSGRGLGLAVRGFDASIVATQPTFGAAERVIGVELTAGTGRRLSFAKSSGRSGTGQRDVEQ